MTNQTHEEYDTIITNYDEGQLGKQYFIRTYKTNKEPGPTRHCRERAAPVNPVNFATNLLLLLWCHSSHDGAAATARGSWS